MVRTVRVVIQCRLSSSRLPGKALLPLAGMPSVVLCARRAANRGADVVVATSLDATDDPLFHVLHAAGLRAVRGPLEDVLTRFEQATQDLAPRDVIVRLTADNMVPDGAFVDELVEAFQEQGLEYLGTHSPLDGLPYGLSAEVFSVEALRRAAREATQSADREHVTPWIRRTFGAAVFRPSTPQRDLSHLRCTMDRFSDYVALHSLFGGVSDPVAVPWGELVARLAASPGAPSVRIPFRARPDGIHSTLTLGTVQLGVPYGAANLTGQPSFAESQAIVAAAIGHGVTSLDCARAYGEAETRIGRILATDFADRVTVVTKLAPAFEASELPTRLAVRAAVDASVLRSCRELGMKRLQVCLLHRWAHRHAFEGAIWERLLELQGEGVIGILGASVSSPAEALSALDDPTVGHLQLPFNLLDWRWKAAGVDRRISARPDVVVHARSALLQGILASAPDRWPVRYRPEASGWVHRLDELARELGREGRLDLCLAYVRSQSWITSVVVGVETVAQLRENVRLFSLPLLDDAECRRLEQSLTGAPESLLDPSRWEEVPA